MGLAPSHDEGPGEGSGQPQASTLGGYHWWQAIMKARHQVGVSVRRAYSVHMTKTNWGLFLQLAIFLPMQSTLHYTWTDTHLRPFLQSLILYSFFVSLGFPCVDIHVKMHAPYNTSRNKKRTHNKRNGPLSAMHPPLLPANAVEES